MLVFCLGVYPNMRFHYDPSFHKYYTFLYYLCILSSYDQDNNDEEIVKVDKMSLISHEPELQKKIRIPIATNND